MDTRLLAQSKLLAELKHQGMTRITTQEACRQTKNLRSPPHVTVWVGEKSMWRSLRPEAVENLWDRRDGQRSLCNLLLRTVFHLNESQYSKLQARFSKPNDVVGIYKGPGSDYVVLVELPKNWVPSNGVAIAGLGLVSIGLATVYGFRNSFPKWGKVSTGQNLKEPRTSLVSLSASSPPIFKMLDAGRDDNPQSVHDRIVLVDLEAKHPHMPQFHVTPLVQQRAPLEPKQVVFGSDMNALINHLLTQHDDTIELKVDLSQSDNVVWHIIATVAHVRENAPLQNLMLTTTKPVECSHLQWVTKLLSTVIHVIKNLTIKEAKLTTTCEWENLPDNLTISSIGLTIVKMPADKVKTNPFLETLLSRCDDAKFTLLEIKSDRTSDELLYTYFEKLKEKSRLSSIFNFANENQRNTFSSSIDDEFHFEPQLGTFDMKLRRNSE